MAMFAKSDRKDNRRPAPPVRTTSAEGAISIIGPGMQVEGNVTTDGTIRVEGIVRGTIRAAKAVVLGKTGEVVGDIMTQDAVIGGQVKGTIVAESRLELQSSCYIEGEVRARTEHLQLHEGARFNGQIQMLDPDEAQPVRALPANVEKPPKA